MNSITLRMYVEKKMNHGEPQPVTKFDADGRSIPPPPLQQTVIMCPCRDHDHTKEHCQMGHVQLLLSPEMADFIKPGVEYQIEITEAPADKPTKAKR